MPLVRFRYLTGLKGSLFDRPRLRGSWTSKGRFSSEWSEMPMRTITAEDGCPAFEAQVELDESELGKEFRWGVLFDGPSGPGEWGIVTDRTLEDVGERYLSFTLTRSPPIQRYYLTLARRLGARKFFVPGRPRPDLRFSVWAPHARAVQVVFSPFARGYVGDDGSGIDPARAPIPLSRDEEGFWSAVVPDFDAHRGACYVYRVTTEQGEIKYRTDVFSRAQRGRGAIRPEVAPWDGNPATLDGSVSCSVIVGQDTCAREPFVDPRARVSREEFWANEYRVGRTVPNHVGDLVIYELHLGALGFGLERPGNLHDALELLDYLEDLGVNAVELLPLSEFSGDFGWGYGDTHHLVIESSAGLLDDYKHFVRECHRRGIAVIQDVCYNHYDAIAERAQWQYDSTLPEHNGYYHYEGKSRDYPDPTGGYVDNGSSGWAPRYSEEVVRQQFIASAALLVEECHVDGLRVDLTQAFHRDNVLHANGAPLPTVNAWGMKFLRQWTRTLRLLRPDLMLIAEDHTGWDKVTESPDVRGLGFTSRWDAAFYHHLIGDADASQGRARLLWQAGRDPSGPLELFPFAHALAQTHSNQVVYHESHDECGNSAGTQRTLLTAVDGAALIGETRRFAEARGRLVFGLSVFSAGTPMFFMGEEVGAVKPFRYSDFREHREDLHGLRRGTGARIFHFYQQAITLRRRHPALRSQEIDVIHADPASRVLAFVRSAGTEKHLIVASFANQAYPAYELTTDAHRLPDGCWVEIHSSDAEAFGGWNEGNGGEGRWSNAGRIELLVPRAAIVVFAKY
ncbi:MAG TPA: alpha-amylase family glycosyl hydrolase [Polyangiaceae bacterium]|nr:alpha-amylase family glycosyl hydrolase [Polyangiaceae bacterium]